MKCPLNCGQYGAYDCFAPNCAFSDEAGDCLISQALQCYVQEKREARAVREAMEKTTYADIFDAFFMPKGVKKEPAGGGRKLEPVRTSEVATGIGY